MIEREQKTVNLSEIKPNPDNPRVIKRSQLKSLQKSLSDFPEMMKLRPIVVDEDGVILGGNMRYQALLENGATETEVETVSGLPPEQKREFIIKDNVSLGDCDWDALANGWDADELEEWGLDIPEPEKVDQEVEEVDVPEVKDGEPKAKLGDIYQLGEHRLICGDSTDVAVIDRLMDGVKADMVFCDAPYGYNYQSNRRTKSEKFDVLENDDKILDFIPAIWGAMKDNCPVYEFCGWQSLKQWLEYFENTSLDLKNVIIWKKNTWSMGDLKGAYAGQYEVILYLNKGRVELNGARDTDIWEFDREPPKMHPTMKPIELIAYALNKSSKKGDVVLDCFGGSGSTLIACEQLNRKCYMCELDPHYCDVIINRWETLTGQKAVLLND